MIFLSQILCIYFVVEIVKSAQINRNIIIDGNFDDWLNVQSYSDPQDNIDGTVYQESPWFSALKIPDCHDGTHMGNENIPKHIYNPNVDIVEFKIAHDDKSLYIYFRVADGGIIGKTSVGSGKFDENNPSNPSPGRFYVITSINLDMNEQTGYWLSEGGYYPTAPGLDGNFELEFYNGTYNQNYYLNHAGNSTNELNYTKEQNRQNQFILGTNFYSYYTQYIYWDHRPTENEIKKCLFGFYELPSPNNNNFICFSQDDAPGPFNGILSYAQSEKGNELEIRAPFQGFLLNKNTGEPTLQLGMTVNISLTLETSPEYSLPQEWCSDSAPTIQYTLSLGHKNVPFFIILFLTLLFLQIVNV
ncbi:unnamed protein product [Didymodactylos carnosus]|uniref:Carbohydrate-binding domain-containing protein n=1 Tax=Didymodactylos carnosus TaxID=1234261 RepID=A0A8S2KZ56_9BILA|nr:unnamed protein product [Didymodactylos carnosus]CAF3866720.1 unnamed protein product [Didymodactylos carnosus]